MTPEQQRRWQLAMDVRAIQPEEWKKAAARGRREVLQTNSSTAGGVKLEDLRSALSVIRGARWLG